MPSISYQLQPRPDGYLSVVPAPNADDLRRHYSEQYFQSPQTSSYQETYDALELRHKALKCSALLHAITQSGITNGEFLDIGAGEGFLMNEARQHRYKVTGIDFSAYGVEKFFPHLQSQLMSGDLYEVLDRLQVSGRRFAVCSAINVLEHVIAPDLFMLKIRNVLEPGGLCAITVPNDFSKLHELLLDNKMIDREFWVAPPQHLHYFNCKNLPVFMASQGFELLDAFTDFPIDLFLLHSGSNYIADAKQGKAAHRARLLADLMIAEAGLSKYLALYRAMFVAELGRDITVLVRPTNK